MLENATTKIWFVSQSGNTKTGIMSVTYTTENTCPARCPFKKNGCYAENFPCCLQWKKTAQKGTEPEKLQEVIKNSCHSEIVRHNVAGDLAKNHSNDIDKKLVETLTETYKNTVKIAYTYTHTTVNKRNIDIVKKASENENNFVINFSTEKISDCKKCLAAGVNCVIACNTIAEKIVNVDGVKVVQCPATYNKEKHCQNCGLCWQKNRNFVIAFPVHGNGKNKAKKAGFLTDI